MPPTGQTCSAQQQKAAYRRPPRGSCPFAELPEIAASAMVSSASEKVSPPLRRLCAAASDFSVRREELGAALVIHIEQRSDDHGKHHQKCITSEVKNWSMQQMDYWRTSFPPYVEDEIVYTVGVAELIGLQTAESTGDARAGSAKNDGAIERSNSARTNLEHTE
jgi:hypothetical protein